MFEKFWPVHPAGEECACYSTTNKRVLDVPGGWLALFLCVLELKFKRR